MENIKKQRDSGIELLKLISILLIVISHVTQTISQNPELLPELAKYFYDFDALYIIDNIQIALLSILRYFGQIGDYLFFICSAWFLCDDNSTKINKILSLVFNVWIISVLFLLIYIACGENLSFSIIARNIIPITMRTNWYVLMYIIVYTIHPLLNSILDKTKKTLLFKILCILFLVYFGICFVEPGYYYSNKLIDFLLVYLIVGFLKKHLLCIDNTKKNIIYFVISASSFLLLLFITYLLGFDLHRWNTSHNPIIFVMTFSLFNIFRSFDFKNKFINKLSSLSLFVYIIHENYLFRNFTRVRFMAHLIDKYGYNHILTMVIITSLCLYIISMIVAYVYSVSIKKNVDYIANSASNYISCIVGKLTNFVYNNFLK